jgi:hypothetical protein
MAHILDRARLSAFTPPTGEKAFDAWVKPQRDGAVKRIFKSVGKYPDGELDLATDIFRACVRAQSALDPLQSSKASGRLKKVTRIFGAIEKQIASIGSDGLSQREYHRRRWSCAKTHYTFALRVTKPPGKAVLACQRMAGEDGPALQFERSASKGTRMACWRRASARVRASFPSSRWPISKRGRRGERSDN